MVLITIVRVASSVQVTITFSIVDMPVIVRQFVVINIFSLIIHITIVGVQMTYVVDIGTIVSIVVIMAILNISMIIIGIIITYNVPTICVHR